jgi:hypothetical protein
MYYETLGQAGRTMLHDDGIVTFRLSPCASLVPNIVMLPVFLQGKLNSNYTTDTYVRNQY